MREKVEASFTVFVIFIFKDNSVKATKQVLFDMGFFYDIDNEDKTQKDYITFIKRRRGELERDKK